MHLLSNMVASDSQICDKVVAGSKMLDMWQAANKNNLHFAMSFWVIHVLKTQEVLPCQVSMT